MVLTEKQKKELNEAILDYLESEGDTFRQTATLFKEEAKLSGSTAANGILEKKWLSIVRLQKKIMDLESQLASRSSATTESKLPSDVRIIPKAPAAGNLLGHRATITCLATHPQFSLLVSGSEDNTIKLWDFETMQYERTLKGHSGAISGVAFDPLGRYLCSCSVDTSAKIWDLKTFACTATLKGHDHSISAIVVMPPTGDFVLTCSRDFTIKAWEVSTGFCTKTYSGHSDWVKTMSVTLNGEYLASGGVDQNILFWRINGSSPIQVLRGHEHVVESVRFGNKPSSTEGQTGETASHSEHILVSGSRDRTVRVWDPIQGSCVMIFTSHENWVRGVLFDPSCRYVISCSDDKSIRVFDIKEQRCVRTIEDAHSHFVSCVAISNVRPVYFSGSVDKTIAIWSCNI